MKTKLTIHKDHLTFFLDHKQLLEKFGVGDVVLEVYSFKQRRSTEQNNYYWGCVVDMIKEYHLALGDIRHDTTPAEIHETLLSLFSIDTSCRFPIIIRSKDMNTLQFTQYIDRIRHNYLHLPKPLVIPLPNEYLESL